MNLRWLMLLAVVSSASAESGSLTGVVRCQTQSVANAIVYLNIASNQNVATNLPPVLLRLSHGEWIPRIQFRRSGATLILRNEDPTLHVVHLDLLSGTNQPRRLVTEAMPYAGYEKSFQLEAFREPVLLKASAGNGEEAVGYAAILPHMWAALTDETGKFSIQTVPVGSYKISVWHETHGTLMRQVNVVSGRATELVVDFPVP